MEEKKENRLISFLKSCHTENFKWNDFFLVPLLLTVVLMLVGQILGNIIVSVLLSSIVTEANYDFISMLALYLSFIGIWIVFLIYFLIPSNRPIYKTLWKKCKGNTLEKLGIGLVIGFATNALCILAAILHRDIFLYYSGANVFLLLLLFVSVFIQSSAEELICRGFLYQRLRRGYKHPAVAIIGNAVLFGALHLGNSGITPLAIISIIVIGICYSLFVYYCDSIWLPMAAHAAWNYTQNIIFGLPNSGIVSAFSIFKLDASVARDSLVYNVGFGVESTVFAVTINVICIILVIIWGKKHAANPTDIWAK